MRDIKYNVISGMPAHNIDYDGWQDSVALFGDSTTYGQALDDKYRLHNVLKTNRKVNNFGYPAESNEHILRKIVDSITEHGFPYMIVVGWSSPWRLSVVENNTTNCIPIGHWTKDYNKEMKAAKELLDNGKFTLRHRTIDIIKAVRLICLDHCKYYDWTVFHMKTDGHPYLGDELLEFKIPQLAFEDRAEDGRHPGPKTVRNLAGMIGNV